MYLINLFIWQFHLIIQLKNLNRICSKAKCANCSCLPVFFFLLSVSCFNWEKVVQYIQFLFWAQPSFHTHIVIQYSSDFELMEASCQIAQALTITMTRRSRSIRSLNATPVLRFVGALHGWVEALRGVLVEMRLCSAFSFLFFFDYHLSTTADEIVDLVLMRVINNDDVAVLIKARRDPV